MKCLLVADIHYDLRKFDWLVEVAPHFEVMVLAGDHLEISSLVDRPAQALVVQKYFKKIQTRTTLLTCSGNHDLDSKDTNGELTSKWLSNVRFLGAHTDGDAITIGDTRFSICPWWDGDNQREAIARQLKSDAQGRPARWIWVHHTPPEDSPTSWTGRRSFGDVALRSWIEEHQPDLVFTGHVHQSPFVPDGSWVDRIGQTVVFNAGHQVGPVPSHVAIDTDRASAFWISLAGAETVDLAAGTPAPLREPPEWIRLMNRAADRPPG